MPSAPLSADAKRSLLIKVSDLIARGATENEQLLELQPLGVSIQRLRGLRADVLSSELEEIQDASSEMIFVRYQLKQRGVVRELREVVERSKDPKCQHNGSAMAAAVNALKSIAQINDTVLERGQSLGVIEKAPSRSISIGGFVVGDASMKDLKAQVRTKGIQLEEIARLAAFSNYLDEEDGDLYYDAPQRMIIDVEPEDEDEEDGPPKRTKVLH